jgi:hypothetical protein
MTVANMTENDLRRVFRETMQERQALPADYRASAGLTLAQVCEKVSPAAHLTPAQLRRYERGDVRNLDDSRTMRRTSLVAECLGVPPSTYRDAVRRAQASKAVPKAPTE